jgi:hypothetical protein
MNDAPGTKRTNVLVDAVEYCTSHLCKRQSTSQMQRRKIEEDYDSAKNEGGGGPNWDLKIRWMAGVPLFSLVSSF